MLAIDVGALNGRLDNLKEDVRSLSDTADQIKETSEHDGLVLVQHGEALEQHGVKLDHLAAQAKEHRTRLAEVRAGQSSLASDMSVFKLRMGRLETADELHTDLLERHGETLDRHTEMLDRHTEMLTELLDRLPPRQ